MVMRSAAKVSIVLLVVIGFVVNVPLASAAEHDSFDISPSFGNLQNHEISTLKESQQTVLYLTIQNKLSEKQPAVIIYEVWNEEEFTVYLAWQTVTIPANGEYEMSVSWLPSAPGNYILRTFALSSLNPEDSEVLSSVFVSEMLTVI